MKPTLPVLAAALLLGLLTACTKNESAPLRVGINAWPGYEFLYLAQEKGFYREAGVDVRLVEFASLSDCRRAYERGQIDAMGSTVIEVLQARDQSARSPQIVQIVDYSDGADVILAQPRITTGSGLRGARIGVELASLGVYLLARGLETSGLNLADVKTVSMDQTSMEEAFRNGELDAVVTYPPFSIKLLHESKARPVFSSSQISGEVLDVIAVEADVIARRPDDVARLLQAYNRAVEYAGQHQEEAHRIMAARERITPAEFKEALTDGIKIVAATEQADYFQPGGKLATVTAASDRILRQSGQIKGPTRTADISTAAFVRK